MQVKSRAHSRATGKAEKAGEKEQGVSSSQEEGKV